MHLTAYKRFSNIRFIKCSLKEKLLLISSFLLLGIVRFLILIIPFKYITLLIGEKMADSPSTMDQKKHGKALKIGRAVSLVSRYTPWESKCLVQAVTALFYLRIFGIPYTLYLGLDKGETNQLLAHAWLRCGELIITGNNEKDRFKVVAQFAKVSSSQIS
ncbi:MAG: lasso peptide biosynthesis B2 protein [Dehalobacter sp.]|jgi:hypothetical protein|nr:lasso peptide biosynthesis B2 protein [Dehalobacter sp.]